MNKKVIMVFVWGLIVGLVVGLVLPIILPKETIYDKLRGAGIGFSQSSWDDGILKVFPYVQQIRSFEEFKVIYNEKTSGVYTPVGEVSNVFVDSSWNVLWIQTKLEMTANYLGFYCYSEPD